MYEFKQGYLPRISELTKILVELKEKHGDVDVLIKRPRVPFSTIDFGEQFSKVYFDEKLNSIIFEYEVHI